jgi:hypothetical protein
VLANPMRKTVLSQTPGVADHYSNTLHKCSSERELAKHHHCDRQAPHTTEKEEETDPAKTAAVHLGVYSTVISTLVAFILIL